ncbi:hypothetical protein BB029_12855 [Pseudomonas sp. S3E12]|nr:hypothetical protein BB029_12855 [Pseudomonas sp. S3E12]
MPESNSFPFWSFSTACWWQAQELPRDNLGTSTKSSLGSTLTLFEIPSNAAAEVMAALKGKPAPAVEDEVEEVSDSRRTAPGRALGGNRK